ncbi:four helix bundle protein [Solitalea sp. MAHUQ-68]|uniref:Four helix bundle protein n=1 Tax=Solitalea agri TaxID=2953739 RepID=A0A9X2JD87_9SPHI|nr:four helix bundle protein [Solitalea agri]MCO4293349.1 four helix bundle protein [Solitalea agri]
MQDYRKLLVWQRSHQFTLEIYKISQDFPKHEQFGVTSQIRRAVFSIPSNIAEGCGKYTKNDLANFLQTSLGSINEVSYLLLLSKDLEYILKENYNKLNSEIDEIKAMMIALINKVRGKE